MSRWRERRNEEEESFRDAFRDLYTAAHRVARRLVGENATAEDCAAEAMARTFASWSRVRDLPYREAWVLRVTTNLAIDLLRRRQPAIEPARDTDGEDALATRLALGAALRGLSKRQRDAVVLRYLHGYTESQVAEALGVSPGTVKTHLRRGLDALRVRLGEDFGRDTIVV